MYQNSLGSFNVQSLNKGIFEKGVWFEFWQEDTYFSSNKFRDFSEFKLNFYCGRFKYCSVSPSHFWQCAKNREKWRFLHSGSSKGRAGMGKLGRDLWLVAENFKVISPLRPIWAWDCAKYSFIIKLDSFLQVLTYLVENLEGGVDI